MATQNRSDAIAYALHNVHHTTYAYLLSASNIFFYPTLEFYTYNFHNYSLIECNVYI